MATLAVQNVDRNGLSPNYAAASVGGDEYENDLYTLLHIKNGGASQITATIAQQAADNQGFTHDIVVAVPAGGEQMIAANPAFYNDPAGKAQVTYSDVTSVTVAAIRRNPTTR